MTIHTHWTGLKRIKDVIFFQVKPTIILSRNEKVEAHDYFIVVRDADQQNGALFTLITAISYMKAVGMQMDSRFF